MKHDAFISYSHAADGKFAPALQRGLEQLAKPWYRLRALRVFRDETNLSASPQLWQAIVDDLSQARWFLLLASPEAGRSKWVGREVAWWLAHREPARLLILLTSGSVLWDEAATPPDFDWRSTTALPTSLSGVFTEEPHFIDVRSLRDDGALTLKHTAFRVAVLKVAAPLHGRSPDEMDGEAVRALGRNRQWAAGAAASLVAVTLAALWQYREAVQARDVALSRQLAAQSTALLERSADTAMLLAAQAWRTQATPEARSAMLRALQRGPVVRFLPGHGSPVVGVALAGPHAGGAAIVASEAGLVTRVRLDGSVPDWSYRSGQPIERMAVSPDGAVVAIGLRDGRIELLSPGRPAPLHVLEGSLKERITALAFAPDGARLVSGSAYRGMALWDVAGGALRAGVPEVFNSSAIDALAFSDDGRSVYAASGLSIAAFDSGTLERKGELGDGKTTPVVDAMSKAPGVPALTVAGWDNNQWHSWLWPTSLGSGAPASLETKVQGVTSLAYNADGHVLALGGRSGEVAFRVAGTEASFKLHRDDVRSMALDAEGRFAVSGGKDGRVILWDRQAQPLYLGKLGPDTLGSAPIAASPDGSVLVSGNTKGQLIWISSGPSAPVFRLGPVIPVLGAAKGRVKGITAVAFSPSDPQVAVGTADGTVALQAIDGSAPTGRALDWGAGYPVMALAFTPDGATLVSAHHDGSVILRDARSAAPLGEPANIVNDSGDGIRALSFSADGSRLLVHTERRGVIVRTLAALSKASRATTESALAQTARVASAAVSSVAVRSPVEERWAWGNSQGQIELRGADDGAAAGEPLFVEGGPYIRTLAFSPDRVSLAVASGDANIFLWDLNERRPVDEPLRGADAVRSMVFTPDGRFLITRGAQSELQWWSTDGEVWARILCRVVNRRFTEREWANYVGSARTGSGACEGKVP